MVIAYHVVLGMYGFWLPNDPRGSGSNFVWSEQLRKYGPATKTDSPQSVAGRPHDSRLRMAAKNDLKYPPVRLNEEQIEILSQGFADAVRVLSLAIHACAIQAEHTHLVISRGDHTIETAVAELKKRGTLALTRSGKHPLMEHRVSGRIHTPWGRGFWKRYLNDREDVERSIRYTNNNLSDDQQAKQQFDFLQEYV
ncbi:MAG: hypothetical protein KDA80_12620 [Planctomycetaceae bacterium]|nr:hypothetical protein [Planctomycetaceae bacterium]